MKFPTYEEMAKDVAEIALDEYIYQGKTLREWVQIISENQDSDCISRKEAMDFFKDDVYVVNELKNLHSVNPQPKTGHWINVNEGKWNTIPAYKCSECGANADLRDWSGKSPYCPWCGAKMIEPQERRDKTDAT